MFQVREIDHIVLRVTDLGAMLRFYTEALGCPVEKRQESIGLIQLRAGRALIDLLVTDAAPATPAPATPANVDHFCLRVEPFDAAAIRAHLARHGIEAGAVASRYGAEGDGPSLYITDPQGNVVELKGPPFNPPAGGAI